MPKGARPTNKTDFQRYMNDHPDSVPSLSKLLAAYRALPYQKSLFGFYLRVKFPAKFDATYKAFWLRHPELHGKVYEGVVQEFAGAQTSCHQRF